MAGAMRKMAVYLGLVEDAEVEEYDDYDDVRRDVRTRDTRSSERRGYDDHPEDRTSTRNVRSVSESRSVRTFRSDDQPVERRPMAPASADISRIETLHPRSYNDARRIGEEYREGVPVIKTLPSFMTVTFCEKPKTRSKSCSTISTGIWCWIV